MLPFKRTDVVLVIAAHYDDEILGAGGLIHECVKNGQKVYVMICTQKTSKRRLDFLRDQKMTEIATSIGGVLGVQKYFFPKLPDSRIELYFSELVDALEVVFEQIQPSLIFTHWIGDTNQDHKAISRATEVLARYFRMKEPLKGIFAYEVAGGTNFSLVGSFDPDLYVKIDPKIKEMVLKKYLHEFERLGGEKFIEGAMTMNKFRGLESGCDFAEGFKILKWRI